MAGGINSEKSVERINPGAAIFPIMGDSYPVKIGSPEERKGYIKKAIKFDEENPNLVDDIAREVILDGLSAKEKEVFWKRRRQFLQDSESQFEAATANGIPLYRVVDSSFPEEANAPTEKNGLLEEERKLTYSRMFSMAILKWIEVQEPGKELTVTKFEIKKGGPGEKDKIERVQMQDPNSNKEKLIDVTEKLVITKDFWKELADQERGDIIFRQLTERFLERMMVHGKAEKLPDGTVRIKQKSDKDGELCERWRKLAGVEGFAVEYVDHNYWEPGVVFADMGNKDGVYYVVEQDRLGEWVVTVYFDHHDPESSGDSSASGTMFETLAALGMIEDSEKYENLLLSIRKSDNGGLPDNYEAEVTRSGLKKREYFLKKYPKTVFGQDYWLSVDESINAYVHDNLGLLDEIDEAKAKKYKLIKQGSNGLDVDYYNQTIRNVEKTMSVVQEIESAGLVLETKEYGKILIDIGGRTMGLGNLVARGLGYGGILRWNEENNSFALTTVNELKHDLGEKNGRRVRKGLWMRKENNDLDGITLEKVLEIISDGNVRLTNGLEDEQVTVPQESKIISDTQEIRYFVNEFLDDLASFYSNIDGASNPENSLGKAKQKLKRLVSMKNLEEVGFTMIDPDKGRRMVTGIREYFSLEGKEPKNWQEIKALLRESDIDENVLRKAKDERFKILKDIKGVDLLGLGKENLIKLVPEDVDEKLELSMYRAINVICDGGLYQGEPFTNFMEATVFFKRYMKVEMPELKPLYYSDIMKDLDLATLTSNKTNRKTERASARKRLLDKGIDVAAYPGEFGDDLKDAFDVYTGHKKDSVRFKEKRLAVNAILDYFKVDREREEREQKIADPVVTETDKEKWRVLEGRRINWEIDSLLSKVGFVEAGEQAEIITQLQAKGVDIRKYIEQVEAVGADVPTYLKELRNMAALNRMDRVKAEAQFPSLFGLYSKTARILGLKWYN